MSPRFVSTRPRRAIGAAAFATLGLFALPAAATEGGASIYLLGSGGPGAAILPPLPGIFADNTVYYYSGSAGGGRRFVVGGNVVAGLDVELLADFATVLWVPTTDFLGGTLAVGGALPFGSVDVGVSATITGPRGGQITVSRSDDTFTVGDPVLMANLGWQPAPKTHVTLATFVNVPIGDYREDHLANVAFHRWAVDTSAAVTWHDPESGWDFSAKAGVTFNGENNYTDYNSGDELHLEIAAEKTFSKSFSAGLQMYHFDQITGDSGPGAALGPFEGRVTGVGATAAYNFHIGPAPVTARVRYFEEIDVKNRTNGSSIFFSLTMPLSVKLPPGAAPP